MAAIPLTTGGLYDVTYYEVPDLYSESWRPGSPTLVRGCRVQWEERDLFVLDILGFVEGVDPDTGRIQRRLPHQHPFYDDFWAVECNMSDRLGVPNQAADGTITFDERDPDGSVNDAGLGDGTGWAVYSVTYTKPNFDILADGAVASEAERYVIRLPKFAIEMLTLPGQAFKWAASGQVGLPADNPGVAVPVSQGGNPLSADITKAFPTQPVVYQWLQVPLTDALEAKFATAIGRVNDAAWDDHGAETLLLQSVEVEPSQHAGGQFLWTVSLHMVKRPSGWNKIYNRTAGNVIPVVNVTGGQPSIYNTYDFNLLFVLT
jgi:hypothetical protein